MRAGEGRPASILSSRAFHLILLAAGALFLLTDAFHGNVWFDESYSVAIANHSFSEIWRIGAGDVHPVLFYWALHVLNLVFGQNILVYRLFAVAGAVALAALGYTHLRRDFGWRVGVLFTFLALFTPYVAIMAVEIRMYSWATFAVMLCAVHAWRICCVLRKRPLQTSEGACSGAGLPEGGRGRVVAAAQGLPAWAGAPRRWWVVFFVSSLASAYLHYFGVLSAFMVNALVLVFLAARAVRLRRGRAKAARGGRALGVFCVGAAVQVALYAPWLAVLAGQVGVVSQTYWANIVFPATYIELASYPVMTSQVSFAARGAYGSGWQIALEIVWAATLALLAAFAAWLAWHAGKRIAARRRASVRAEAAPRRLGRWLCSDAVMPAVAALVVYGGVYAIGLAASFAMDSMILYYRYLFVAIGPLLFACAFLLAKVRSRVLAAAFCAVLLSVTAINQYLLIWDDYAPENQVPLEKLQEQAGALSVAQGDGPVLVVSTDIGFMGVSSVLLPGIPQTYMDWQKGNWDLSYQAYGPTLTSKKSWELILDDFHGTFVVLGQSPNGEEPRDVADLRQKPGITLLDSDTYFRPYERTWFTIAVMQKA